MRESVGRPPGSFKDQPTVQCAAAPNPAMPNSMHSKMESVSVCFHHDMPVISALPQICQTLFPPAQISDSLNLG